MKKNPVVHFEMPYTKAQRVAEFYATAFGWGMQTTGEEYGGYVLATTTETDAEGMVKTPGNINGGFYPKGDYGTIPHVVISVDNLEESMKMVVEAGGEVLGEPMEIPNIGTFVMIRDTEGNKVGVLQPVA